MKAEHGQALVELVAGVPALLALGLILLQLLAVGHAAVLAGSAAEAGALAVAGGVDPKKRVRDALPASSRSRVRVEVSGGEVRVQLRPRALIPFATDALTVTGRAEVAGQ